MGMIVIIWELWLLFQPFSTIVIYSYMGVSINGDTPKSSTVIVTIVTIATIVVIS